MWAVPGVLSLAFAVLLGLDEAHTAAAGYVVAGVLCFGVLAIDSVHDRLTEIRDRLPAPTPDHED